MVNPMYYQQTPISEKPDKNDYYLVRLSTDTLFYPAIFENGTWYKKRDHDGELVKYHTYYPIEWLKPITGVVRTEEEKAQIPAPEPPLGYTDEEAYAYILGYTDAIYAIESRFKLIKK